MPILMGGMSSNGPTVLSQGLIPVWLRWTVGRRRSVTDWDAVNKKTLLASLQG
jgi:hypothetical protein